MSTPEYYRHWERECLREAEKATEQPAKESWLLMAKSWADLAKQADGGVFTAVPTSSNRGT